MPSLTQPGLCVQAVLESEAFGRFVPPAFPEQEVVTSPLASSTSPASFAHGQPTANGIAHGHAALANGPSPKLSAKVSAVGTLQPEPQQATLREQVADWVERVLIPAIQQQVAPVARQRHVLQKTSGIVQLRMFCMPQDRNGWDIMRALAVVKSEYKHDPVTVKAAVAIEKRVRLVCSWRRM